VDATNPERFGFLATLLSIFFSLNLILFTFNLLPVPPLDGSTGIAVFLPEATAVRLIDFYHSSGLGFAGILIAWVVYRYVFDWVAPRAIHLLFLGV